MKELTKIQRLYEKIPGFECIPGCTQCCENYIQSAPEERLRAPLLDDGAICAYIQDSRCAAHDVRPFVCRIFGGSEMLVCPHGCGPEKLLTKQETIDLLNEYITIKTEQEKKI